MKLSESQINLLNALVNVKSSAELDVGVEEARPAACARCGVAAGCVGSLRTRGHGRRARNAWGPATADPGAVPEVMGLSFRRYRCLECKHVMTIRYRLLARYFRYTTAAIALTLWIWGVTGRSASVMRHEVSPWPLRGLSEAHSWRSLSCWLGRPKDLLGLPKELGETGRSQAHRAVQLMTARAPPELPARVRAFVGAQLR